MKNPADLKEISESEALRIVNELDVGAFLRYISYDMDEVNAGRRLLHYREELLENIHPAKFFLDRNRYIGASDAGVLARIAAEENGIDMSKLGINMWFANPYEFIATKLGDLDPSRTTPRSRQGHELEPYIGSVLMSRHGYTKTEGTIAALEKINNYVDPSMPYFRTTLDEVFEIDVYDENTGRSIRVPAIVEKKAVVHDNNFQSVMPLHEFQVQAQLLAARMAGVDINHGIVAYYDYDLATVHTLPVTPRDVLQNSIQAGYEIALDYIDSKTKPIYREVLPDSEMSKDDIMRGRELLLLLGTVSAAKKEITDTYNSIVDRTQTFMRAATPTTERGELNGQMLTKDSPIPKGVVRMKSEFKPDYAKIEESAKERGIYTEYLSTSNTVEDMPGLLAAAKRSGLDVEEFLKKDFDFEGAMRSLQDVHKIPTQDLAKLAINVSAVDARKNTNQKSAGYSKRLFDGVEKHKATFLSKIASENSMDVSNVGEQTGVLKTMDSKERQSEQSLNKKVAT